MRQSHGAPGGIVTIRHLRVNHAVAMEFPSCLKTCLSLCRNAHRQCQHFHIAISHAVALCQTQTLHTDNLGAGGLAADSLPDRIIDNVRELTFAQSFPRFPVGSCRNTVVGDEAFLRILWWQIAESCHIGLVFESYKHHLVGSEEYIVIGRMLLSSIGCVLGDVWSQIDGRAHDDRLALRVSDGKAQTGSRHLGEADDATMPNGG